MTGVRLQEKGSERQPGGEDGHEESADIQDRSTFARSRQPIHLRKPRTRPRL